MRNPYKILGVSQQADDDAIRKAWLVKVRQYPPEIAPEQFKRISQAYEQIKTHKDRIRHFLFSTDNYIDSPLEALTGEMTETSSRKIPTVEDLQKTIVHSFQSVYIKRKR